MDATQRDKQMRAAARLASAPASAGDATHAALESRIKEAAGGNPGLQALLSRPLLAGETEAAERALAAVESYRQSGEVPREASAAAEFFEHVSLTAFRDMLTPAETQQLRAATLFSLPVPRSALIAAGEAAAVGEPERAIDRLHGLGLLDRYLAEANEEVAINPLARPLVPALTQTETAQLAKAAAAPLYALWKRSDGSLPLDWKALEVLQVALLGKAPPEIVNPAARAGGLFVKWHRQIGLVVANLLRNDGRLGEALKVLSEDVLPLYQWLGSGRERAETIGIIASILEARGELDRAVKIRTEEELPVYERIGEVHALLVGRKNLAAALLRRNGDADRNEASKLLHLALADARRLQLPEAAEIEQIIEQAFAGLSPEGGSGGPPDGASPLLEAEPPFVGSSPEEDAPSRGLSGAPTLAPHPAADADKAEYLVWYGTNRRPIDPGDAGKGYSAAREEPGVVHYGSCRVFIPKSH
ncbi:MAG TPA: hypothetical protein VGF07_03370, partial [Stellaceae bacterium]